MGPIDRFRDSMEMDFDKWHDGVGYDLSTLDSMTETELKRCEDLILSKGVTDWRDLDALERIGLPTGLAAILRARESEYSELRLHAQQYGPPPSEQDRESAIVAALGESEPFAGLSDALDEAASYPSPKVIQALVEVVRNRPGVPAYNAAATLYFLQGKISSPNSFQNRAFLLKFSEPDSPERQAAFAQLIEELNLGESV